MKEIPLTQGKVALVDEEDYEALASFKWFMVKSGRTSYAQRGEPDAHGKCFKVYMHRIVLNPQPQQEVDHKNGNGLDNRRENLRVCTCQENQHNQSKRPGTSSRFKGVTWNKAHSKWQAQIRIGGQRRYLGNFALEEEAARAYDAAAIRLFGEFAHLNVFG